MSNNDENRPGVAIDQAFNVLENEDTQALLNSQLEQLAQMSEATPAEERYTLELDISSSQLALENKTEAWDLAKGCFEHFIEMCLWQKAVEACDVMFQCELDDSIIALANGVWLAVTFPITPETSVAMLQHIIDETPDNSDGAAVAAITAHYLADIRYEGDKAESLKFLATQMIAQVAKRHSQVTDQDMLEFWIERMELKDPAVFLPKLAKVLDIIINDKWWYDRDKLRQLIPDN